MPMRALVRRENHVGIGTMICAKCCTVLDLLHRLSGTQRYMEIYTDEYRLLAVLNGCQGLGALLGLLQYQKSQTVVRGQR